MLGAPAQKLCQESDSQARNHVGVPSELRASVTLEASHGLGVFVFTHLLISKIKVLKDL